MKPLRNGMAVGVTALAAVAFAGAAAMLLDFSYSSPKAYENEAVLRLMFDDGGQSRWRPKANPQFLD